MSWDDIIIGTAQSQKKLTNQIDALLALQRSTWTAFREAESSLSKLASKRICRDNTRIIVQANPGRSGSVRADVDPVSISRRPCFLCEENIPPEECGIGFGEFVILPNPFPILRRHLTIPLREHCPQRLGGSVERMLELARAIGPDMLVIYNGAACGASAPDHLHFQACSATGVPLLGEVSGASGKDEITALTSFGRRMLVCHHQRVDRVVDFIHKTLSALSTSGCDDVEPMLNIVVVFRGERYSVFVFPRAKHRPKCYFADDNSRISISPGALEMAGILVVADPEHFERVDEGTAHAIYEEVSLDDETFTTLVETVT